MCTDIMACHGDGPAKLSKSMKKFDGNEDEKCKLATFYITSDGKYAIHTDHLTEEQANSSDLNIDNIPKIELK